jgi:hypothetical protein
MPEEFYCQEHQTKFYRNERNGKVWYSHKIQGSDPPKFCNMPKDAPKPEKPSVDAPESKSKPLGTQGIPIPPSDSRGDSIERQVAAKICGEWVREKVIDPGAFVPNAEWVYRWISGKLTLSPESLANIELIMVSNLQDMVDRLRAKAQTKKATKNEAPG